MVRTFGEDEIFDAGHYRGEPVPHRGEGDGEVGDLRGESRVSLLHRIEENRVDHVLVSQFANPSGHGC